MSQLSLFGPQRATATVAPVDDPSARELASRLPLGVRFGTSSWTFPGWAGLVYAGTPSQAALIRDGLGAYAQHPLLGTVGIDRGFYAPIPREHLAAYAAQLPSGFLAVSKVWDEITTRVFPHHPRFAARAGTKNPAFLDPSVTREMVIEPYADAFAEHAGPFVFELSPMPHNALPTERELAAAIERLVFALPTRFRYAFELRNPELLTPRYLDVLRAVGAAHVVNFWSRMPTPRQQLALPGVLTADFVVARLMLPPGARYEDKKRELAPFDRVVSPQPELRDTIVELARACAIAGRALFVIVNNKAEGCSPLTIRAIAEQLAKSPDRA